MPNNTEWNKYYTTLPYGGAVYTETNQHNFIVEPWNAISSLAIVLPAIYWLFKLRGKYKEFKFLSICIPLLFIGGLGSTLFHAFRTSPLLLIMDFLPILILTLLVSLHLWVKVLKKWFWVVALYTVILSIRYYVPDYLSNHDAINLRYFINGCLIFLPALMLIITHRGRGKFLIIFAIASFGLALYCRKIDAMTPPLMEQGTHWLWHILTGIGTLFLSQYLYILERIYNQRRKSAIEAKFVENAEGLNNTLSTTPTITN